MANPFGVVSGATWLLWRKEPQVKASEQRGENIIDLSKRETMAIDNCHSSASHVCQREAESVKRHQCFIESFATCMKKTGIYKSLKDSSVDNSNKPSNKI